MDHKTMYIALTLFGSIVINEVFEIVKVSSPEVAYESFTKMNMKRFADCTKFLFY